MQEKQFRKLEDIKSHFGQVDPVISKLMHQKNIGLLTQANTSVNYFLNLCGEIIGQQLAGRAADAIIKRFFNLFPNNHVVPEKILELKEEDLRNVGMSWAKARYIRDLAQKTIDEALDFENLNTMADEAIVKELMKVKGIGKWTAEMFLIFTLGRENIFSYGDLGLRKAIRILYGFKDRPTDIEITPIVKKWSPYKSYASLALWKSMD